MNACLSKTAETSLGRRSTLKIAGAVLAAPMLWIPKASAATQLIVRTPGGQYDQVRQRVVYEPFQKATGIEVVPVTATMGKMFAMFKSGNVELDVIDTGNWPLTLIERQGALAPIPYNEFQFSNPEDIDPSYREKYQTGAYLFAETMAYNTAAFNASSAPTTWAEFWDDKRFVGPRMLADDTVGAPDLEFALLADGVPKDKLYPLDIDRGLRSLTRLRPSIRKFWDTGALPTQMLADREVVLASLWSTRGLEAIKRGAPIAMNWNEHMALVQALGIPKGARNPDGAKKFIDFCMSPSIQTEFSTVYPGSGPSNMKAHAAISAKTREFIPGGEFTKSKGFVLNGPWCADNHDKVSAAWSKWILNR